MVESYGKAMNPVIISTKGLFQSPRALGSTTADAISQKTRFADLPLQARLLLAVPRVRGRLPKAPIAERYVLDALGRIIDAGPERHQTIVAVNLLAEALLTPGPLSESPEQTDGQWLSSVENLVLCVLCKVRSGNQKEAAQLTKHWLTKSSVESFNAATVALCNSECFKRAGPHVFTPSWSGAAARGTSLTCRSVSYVNELSLGELLLLNAIRLRMRTLRYAGIGNRVVPMLREHLALPQIESLLDALLVESLQYSANSTDVRCFCSKAISVNEAQFLDAVAAMSTGDNELVTQQLKSWLPISSVERLRARLEEFQSIVQNIGTAIPLREWDFAELANCSQHHKQCEHINEPPMIH